MGAPKDRSRKTRSNHFVRTYVSAALRRYDVMLASLGLNALTLALPLVILQMYDRVIPEGSLDTFALLMTGIAVVVVIDGLLRLVRSRVTSWAAARFEHAAICPVIQIQQIIAASFHAHDQRACIGNKAAADLAQKLHIVQMIATDSLRNDGAVENHRWGRVLDIQR